MSEHPNAAGVREAIETYTRGDFTTMGTFLADDIVWHVGGAHPLSGDYRGRDAVLSYFTRAQELTTRTLKLELQRVLANDSYGAAFLRATGSRNRIELDVMLFEAFRFDAFGRWAEYWAQADDQPLLDQFWS